MSILIIWIIVSFIILTSYAQCVNCYEMSDYLNLLVMILCLPAVFIIATIMLVVEEIERKGRGKCQ